MEKGNAMEPRNENEQDDRQEHESTAQGEPPASSSAPLPSTFAHAQSSKRTRDPEQTEVIETSRIRAADEASNPTFVVVPVQTQQLGPASSGASDRTRRDERAQHDQSDRKDRQKDDQDKSAGRHTDPQQGSAKQGPSLKKILLYSGLVALVCGVLGAFGYSYFFGGSGKSDDKKSSSKSSGSSKDSGSSGGSSSGESSDSGQGSSSDQSSGSSKKESEADKLVQAESAWMTAVKEYQQAQAAEKAARKSEEETKAVLNFLRNTLLSAGRPTDGSLADAFWSGGQGRDLTLRKAIDVSESKVNEAFADRPLAEASVREMLGAAYLNLGAAPEAVKQFERALSLREAMQGMSAPESAACRNQLAVAYRLAGRAGEGGRLFNRNLDSSAHADGLAARGAMLLVQKQPADAELKLREALKIRQKARPDDWKTFDAESMLGQAMLDQKKTAEAKPLLLSGYQGMKQHENDIPMQEQSHLTQALERLVRLYEIDGNDNESTRWRRELEAVRAKLDTARSKKKDDRPSATPQ